MSIYDHIPTHPSPYPLPTFPSYGEEEDTRGVNEYTPMTDIDVRSPYHHAPEECLRQPRCIHCEATMKGIEERLNEAVGNIEKICKRVASLEQRFNSMCAALEPAYDPRNPGYVPCVYCHNYQVRLRTAPFPTYTSSSQSPIQPSSQSSTPPPFDRCIPRSSSSNGR